MDPLSSTHTTSQSKRPALVAVYDGDCGICTRFARWVVQRDGERRIEFLPSQSPDVVKRFPEVPPEAYATSVQVFEADGTRFDQAAGIARILKELPGWAALAFVLTFPGLGWFWNLGYRLVAANRGRFGSACTVPNPTDATEGPTS